MNPPQDEALAGWAFDPEDPRAPTQAQWDAMTDAGREHVLATLPSSYELELAPEGDPHTDAFLDARQTLRRWFSQHNPRLYVAGQMGVYYPGEARFEPDIYAVTDVGPHSRDSWVVSREGKGLDLALEVHVHGDRKKDFEVNVVRYARLGIAEYYVFDKGRDQLVAHQLTNGAYSRRQPRGGRFHSDILGLDLHVAGGRLRFSHGEAEIPHAEELIDKLQTLADEGVSRAETLAVALAEEQRLREEEQRLREQEQATAAARIAELEAELAKLKRE